MSVRMMRNLGTAVLCVAAVLLPSVLLAQAPLPQAPKKSEIIASGGKMIPGGQVKKMYLGNTVYLIWLIDYRGIAKRGHVSPVYYPDEHHRINLNQGKMVESLWWMEGDAYCVEIVDGTGRACSLVYEFKDRIFACNRDEDICWTMQRMVPGNPEGM